MPRITAEILVLQEGRPAHATPLGDDAVLVGRAPDNDLILSDGRVSGRHAIFHLSADRGAVVLRDLASTNGTFVNGDRVTGSVEVREGDEILLARTTHLAVRIQPFEASADDLPVFPALLVDLHSGVGVAVKERMRVGSDPDCDVRIPDVAPLFASITVHDEGAEIWVGTDEEEFRVVLGVPFALGGRELVFRDHAVAWQETQRESEAFEMYPYRLMVDASMNEAVVEHRRTGVRHVVTTERRVALLYVLGRRRHLDLRAGVRPSMAGWMDDERIAIEVWGRASAQMTANNYQVLLSRVRREIREGGLDPWFIEKRQGQTRIRLNLIEIP